MDSNAVSPRTRSSQQIQRSNARSQGSEVTFARGDVDDTPRAVDAATAVPKQSARSWKSLSEIDSNTGSQRSGDTFGCKEVHDTPYLPLYEYYAILGVRQHTILLPAQLFSNSLIAANSRIQQRPGVHIWTERGSPRSNVRTRGSRQYSSRWG